MAFLWYVQYMYYMLRPASTTPWQTDHEDISLHVFPVPVPCYSMAKGFFFPCNWEQGCSLFSAVHLAIAVLHSHWCLYRLATNVWNQCLEDFADVTKKKKPGARQLLLKIVSLNNWKPKNCIQQIIGRFFRLLTDILSLCRPGWTSETLSWYLWILDWLMRTRDQF